MQKLIYVTDVLCGWCYGMGPVIERFLAEQGDAFDVEIMIYGLCPDEKAYEFVPQMRDDFHKQLDQLSGRTGAEFSPAFLDMVMRPGFRYDSQPSAQSVIAARRTDPSLVLKYIHSLQFLMNVHGADPAVENSFIEAARKIGLDEDKFRSNLKREDLRDVTYAEYEKARGLGVRGVPTTLIGTPPNHVRVHTGFVSFDQYCEKITKILDESQSLEGFFCKDNKVCI